jgi:phage-related protein
MLLNGTLTLTPLGWITVIIGGLIAVGVALYENWDLICAKASELWAFLSGAFTGIGQAITGAFNCVEESITGVINYCIDGINKLIEGFNGLLMFQVPDWLGGGSVGVSIPTIPHFATGTQYFGGGLAEIGEHGGEIVNLPNGSQVIPADKTDKILNGSGGTIVNVTVQGNVIGNHQFVNELGEIITGKLKLALSNN